MEIFDVLGGRENVVAIWKDNKINYQMIKNKKIVEFYRDRIFSL